MGYNDVLNSITSAAKLMGDTNAENFRNNLEQYASASVDDMGAIHELKAEVRSEFRQIYASIIDSTIAAMY